MPLFQRHAVTYCCIQCSVPVYSSCKLVEVLSMKCVGLAGSGASRLSYIRTHTAHSCLHADRHSERDGQKSMRCALDIRAREQSKTRSLGKTDLARLRNR